MKNLGLFCLLWIGLLLPLHAQITITNAVFPAVGDTLFYAVDNQPGDIVMTAPGGNQQWDFSHLDASFTWQQVFQDAQTGPEYDAFPSARLYYQTDADVRAYLNVSAQHVSLLGFSGGSPATFGLDLVPHYNPPIVQSRAPLQFFDIHQVSSGLLLPFSTDIIPDIGQFPVRPDSLRLRVAINRLDVVDAWGTLTIPGGSFDVLRQKRTEYREARLDAKVPPLGWLDVTDVAIQALQLGSGLGVDTTVSYHFLNDQSKAAIAIVTTDNSQLRVVGVQYKDLGVSTGTNHVEQAIADLAVFPNPADEVLHLRAGGLSGGDYTVFIYTLLGQEVYRKSGVKAAGALEENLEIGRLEKGVYVCQIFHADGSMGRAIFFKH